MSAAVPLQDRIVAAMNGRTRAPYWEVLEICFPKTEDSNAWNYSSNGGPAGCQMAFGKALRKLGFYHMGRGSQRQIHKVQAAAK